jgi:hypothetical protein
MNKPPLESPIFDLRNATTDSRWIEWISLAHVFLFSVQESGPSTNRPPKRLWIGRRYFDTTLGLPVYVKSVKPTVWVNAAGAVV